ncbi:MAG: choice-of-anchor B family protein [Flavobacteriales bacterium]|nr:choice-of-anchor B family protein [Flavobacteriales bacterium]
MNLLYHWDDTTITLNTRDARYSDIWGFEISNRDYVVMGSTFGANFFDITDPVNSYFIDSVQGAVTGSSVNHRDYKEFKGYVYACGQQDAATLQIMDCNYLPDSVIVVYDSDSLFSQAHNLYIDSVSERLYACGADSNGLSIYSLVDPVNPELLLHYNDVGSVHDMYSRNDTLYLNCGSSGLFVVDLIDVSNPELIGSLTQYPGQGYNHSGWLNAQGNQYVFTDEDYGRDIKICDVSDLGNIEIIGTINSGVSPNSVAHNAFIKDEVIYVSYYNDGFQMFRIVPPPSPAKIGYFDTFLPAQDDDYRGAWGCYPFFDNGIVAISDRNSGLYILDTSPALALVVSENHLVKKTVFPNPTTGKVRISGCDKGCEVVIVDVFGRLVIRKQSSNGLDLSSLKNGTYFIQVTDKEVSTFDVLIKADVY